MVQKRDNLAELIKANAPLIILKWLGEPVRQLGDEWIYHAPYRKDESPSFRIKHATGEWFDDPIQEGGDLIVAYAKTQQVDHKGPQFVRLCRELLAFGGVKFDAPKKTAPALSEWDGSLDTFAEEYGLTWFDYSSEGHRHNGMTYPYAGIHEKIPSIQYGITLYNSDVKISSYRSVQRRLDTNKRLKIIAPSKQKKRGLIQGNDWLAKCEGKTLVLVGGEDKRLAALKAGYPAVAMDLGEGDLHKDQVALIKEADPMEVVVAYDNDQKGADNALKACQTLYDGAAAPLVRYVVWPSGLVAGRDLNDDLKEGGSPLITERIEGAAVFTPRIFADTDKTEANPAEADSSIQIGTDEYRVVSEVIHALAVNIGDDLFVRNEVLCRVRDGIHVEESGEVIQYPKIEPLPIPALRTLITRGAPLAKWVPSRRAWVNSHPPEWLPKAVFHASDFPGIRNLKGIAQGPIIRQDGSVCREIGFDRRSAYYMVNTYQDWSCIAEDPEYDDAMKARDTLAELMSEFQFEHQYHLAGWFAMLLTLVGRNLVKGPVPAFILEGNVRGSGKTFAVQIAALIAFGQKLPTQGRPPDEAEWQKVITAHVIGGSRAVFMDNLNTGSSFQCAPLESLLTQESWGGRILGKSETVPMPCNIVWLLSGNNIQIKGDMVRRVLPIRFKSTYENPELRTDFKIPNILSHVTENRAKYYACAVTLWVWWLKNGMPSKRLLPWGSYESFTDTVRQVVANAGLPDPGKCREEFLGDGDSDRLMAIALVKILKWAREPGTRGASAARMLEWSGELFEEDIEKRRVWQAFLSMVSSNKPATPNLLSRCVNRHIGRVVDGESIERRVYAGTTVWYVKKLGESAKEAEAEETAPAKEETTDDGWF